MKNFLKILVIITILPFLYISVSANGLNLNGIGSRASGMGTAYIGLSDDFSAVFFNPAGLSQIEETSLSVFVTDLIPKGTYKFELMGITLADAKTVNSMYPSGSISYFKPFSKKLVAGIALYVPSGAGAKWSGDELKMLTGGKPYTWDSTIFMITLSPAAAYKFSEKFSIGASINLNYVTLNMERPGGDGSTIPFFQYSEKMSKFALGATVGLMYKPTKKLSFGLTLKAPVKASITGTAKAPFLANLGLAAESKGTREATWPLWLGMGVAFKPTDRITITADVTYSEWFSLQNIPVKFDELSWKFAGMDEGSEFILNWDNTIDYKIGIEYKLSDTFALRGGYYTDHSPSPEETLNIMLPSIDYRGVTLGFGYKKGKIRTDFALEYLSGRSRTVNPMNYYAGAGMPGVHGMKIIVPNITISYVFGK